jgi:hypothetical protein
MKVEYKTNTFKEMKVVIEKELGKHWDEYTIRADGAWIATVSVFKTGDSVSLIPARGEAFRIYKGPKQ